MGSLADLPKLIGFFSYSRNDDEGDDGAVSHWQTAFTGNSGRS